MYNAAKVIDTASVVRALSGCRLRSGVWVSTGATRYTGSFRTDPTPPPVIRVLQRAQITDSSWTDRAAAAANTEVCRTVNERAPDAEYARACRLREYTASRASRVTDVCTRDREHTERLLVTSFFF